MTVTALELVGNAEAIIDGERGGDKPSLELRSLDDDAILSTRSKAGATFEWRGVRSEIQCKKLSSQYVRNVRSCGYRRRVRDEGSKVMVTESGIAYRVLIAAQDHRCRHRASHCPVGLQGLGSKPTESFPKNGSS